MTKLSDRPSQRGQLVWCPADPTTGIGVVTEVEGSHVRVRFWRQQDERSYTTRGVEAAIVRYQIGQGERVRDAEGNEHRVTRPVAAADGLITYELEDGTTRPESELVPEVRDIGPKERLANLTLAHPEVVRARAAGIALSHLGQRPGRAAVLGARVQWLPHQVDVACRAVERDPVRRLLADEVGLGKTVEAALIYAGLRQEGRAQRVLVLTPESLTIQWLGELFRKTHELLVLLDDERIEDAQRDMPELGPFEAYQRIVASIDRVAGDELLAGLAAEASWDLVIVDEAHHLRWRPEGGGNAAYKLIESLAARTRHLLLLTATPMALDPAEYHALLRLLDPTRFDDPEAFEAVEQRVAGIRELGRAVASVAAGESASIEVPAAEAKRLLDDDAEDVELFNRMMVAKVPAQERRELAGKLLEALRERHALADYVVRNRRGPVGGMPARKPEIVALEPSEKQDALIEVGESVMLDLAKSMEDPAEACSTLGRLLRALWATPRALADILRPVSPELVKELTPLIDDVVKAPLDAQRLPTGDMRLRWLVQQIRALAPGEKLLVFVETSVAVRALADALEPVVGQVAVFHRNLAARDQDRQVAWFRDATGPSVMLSTEAGGEGRNFQFCSKVVLYDLPWRPATIEQRIGRIDRVGQTRDVHVLVPHFKSGYEAAILKVMQQSIGVLDKTVGGIDHQLEYVSDRLAMLVMDGAGPDEWKDLYRATDKLVREARVRIENDVDPILDHASFSPARASAILGAVPADLEGKLEEFVLRFADHTKVALKPKGPHLYAIENAPGAAGREDAETGYVATFSRTYALDHEDVEFLSFGHPLVQHALEWARDAHDATAALALCRGFERDGAIFIWRYELDLPDDVPEASAYFDETAFTLALDEQGKRAEGLEGLLLDDTRSLDRMDPAPLKASLPRWRKLIDGNHESADAEALRVVEAVRARARERLSGVLAQRERDLKRSHAREVARHKPKSKGRKQADAMHATELESLAAERARLEHAVAGAVPRLQVVVAVRLMRAKSVSA